MTLALEIALSQDDPLRHFIKCGNVLPSIRRTLIDPETGLPISLVDATCQFVVTELDKTPLFDAAAVVEDDGATGIVRYDFTVYDTVDPGSFLAEFQITFPEGQTLTYPPANADPERSYIRLQIVDGLPTAPITEP